MKTKVTLLGDSIRQIGYGSVVPELLGDEYEVYQPSENCRFSKYTLRGVIVEWAEGISGSKIIHWNNGLWDVSDDGEGVFTSPDEYVKTMTRIASILKKKAEIVIFATTTPVSSKNKTQCNDRIQKYNQLIVPVLSNMGIIINDLYSLVARNISDYIREDDLIHLTPRGSQACGRQIVNLIKSL